MCRNIRTLHNFDPPANDEEVHDAALQYVRKISGSRKPSQANEEVFDRAVEEITAATERLLDGLVTNAPPKDREVEAAKRKARSEARFANAEVAEGPAGTGPGAFRSAPLVGVQAARVPGSREAERLRAPARAARSVDAGSRPRGASLICGPRTGEGRICASATRRSAWAT